MPAARLLKRWGVVSSWVLITACSTPASLPLASQTAMTLPPQVEWTQVPFYSQEDDQCGPAALAIVLSHAGVPRTPEQMRDEVYLPLRRGSLPIEMVSAVRRTGLTPRVLDTDLSGLLQEVAQGRPVTVLMNLRWRLWPQWHYAVVVGYDLPQDQIILRSGSEQRHVMASQDFDAQWAGAQRWALSVWPASNPEPVSRRRVARPPTD